VVRRSITILACALACAVPATAHATPGALGSAPRPAQLAGAASVDSAASSAGRSTSSDAPIPVPPSDTPPAGRRLSANQVMAIAAALPKMKSVRAKYPGSYGGAYLKIPFHWQVSYFSRNGKKEIGQVTIDDLSGRVLEQWTGFQVAWTMARGYRGAFGRHVNALYIWLPLCALFVVRASTNRCRSSIRRCSTCSRECSRWRAADGPAGSPARCACSCPRRGWRSAWSS